MRHFVPLEPLEIFCARRDFTNNMIAIHPFPVNFFADFIDPFSVLGCTTDEYIYIYCLLLFDEGLRLLAKFGVLVLIYRVHAPYISLSSSLFAEGLFEAIYIYIYIRVMYRPRRLPARRRRGRLRAEG